MSGDPRPHRVVLWTRVDPYAAAGLPVAVTWEVATSPDFADVVGSGSSVADPAGDHCVKVVATGLPSDRWLWYRFAAFGAQSPIGRARTAPASDASPDRVRFAVANCQSFVNGFWGAYRAMAREDVDFVLHLGDYIYEHGGKEPKYGHNGVRHDPTVNPRSRAEFRAKYRLYRGDGNLQACHQNLPLVVTWDDHEIIDNYDGDYDPAILEAGYGAWFEYMPHEAPPEAPRRVHRRLRWGDLLDLFVLDSRQFRDGEIGSPFLFLRPDDVALDPGRSLLGSEQKAWLLNGLARSRSAWRFLGNPVMLSPLRVLDLDEPVLRALVPGLVRNAGVYLNGDQWDAFQHERNEILEHLARRGIGDNVVLTGDIHSYWAGVVPTDVDDAASPRVATEFVTGAVTAPGIEETVGYQPGLESWLARANPHFSYVNLFAKGYTVVEVTQEAVTVEFRFVDVMAPEALPETGAVFRVRAGTTAVERLA